MSLPALGARGLDTEVPVRWSSSWNPRRLSRPLAVLRCAAPRAVVARRDVQNEIKALE
jgi:hypothetical protein